MEYLIYNIEDLTNEEYRKWFSLMSEERQKKINRYKDEARKKCSVAGEMLVKKHISKILNISPESIKISIDDNGKPFIKDCDIHFNISHCENMVICAFGSESIGVDIEKIKPTTLSVLKRFYSSSEQEYVFGFVPKDEDLKLCENTEILERFYRIFTLKEAICKKSGIGIKGLKKADALPYLDHSFKENEYIISIIE